jgi:apolipoprotein N-acyltransferase
MLLEGDQVVARFDKSRLVMFSEHIPFRDTFPAIAKIMPRGSGHFARGTDIVTFPLRVGEEDYRLAPMICFEDIIAGFGRELAALHPHLLVNLTNDTWFGDSSEPWQHLALSVFRAVEMRTDMIRAVNSGVTAFVDANGRVVDKTYVIDPASRLMRMEGLLGEVALVEGGHSLYARFGELFAYVCTAALFALWLGWPLLLRWRRRQSS